MSAPGPQYLEWEDAGGACVIRFTVNTLRDDRVIRLLFDQIDRLVNEAGYRKVVLNFAGIEAFASYAIGKLVVLNNKLQPPDSRLALCSLTPVIHEIMDIMNLRSRFRIFDNEQEALQSFA